MELVTQDVGTYALRPIPRKPSKKAIFYLLLWGRHQMKLEEQAICWRPAAPTSAWMVIDKPTVPLGTAGKEQAPIARTFIACDV
ncbi:hypothetical protein HSBAA_00260 [Vreelandella sulfidaeris]|uniref:Uncharacterized protein n=1 Tax=Vreelandella sulfidaeris TaxID=115553 RepID=A0A455TZ10_9GAMM|nr:hypothetical protein HSBAA_00260 [Halomonas sulfidaeris]